MPRSWLNHTLTLALVLLLGVVLLVPIAFVVREGFLDEGKFSLVWFQDVWTFLPYRRGLINSFWLATFATLLCLIISIPLALLAQSFDFAGKRMWMALIQVPMILPPFVGAIGLKFMLSRTGGLNSLLAWMGLIDPARPIDWLANPFWSCVVLEALYLYPITLLNIQAALANIDPALHEAARNLGSGPWRRFFRITLPLMRPGIFAGSTLVFIWAFTELGTPLMVGYSEVTAVQVFRALETTQPAGDAYALVVVLLIASTSLYAVGKLLLGRPTGAMLAKATMAAIPTRLRGWRSLAATAPFAVVFFIAVVPHIGVVLGSFSTTGMLEVSPDRLTLQHHLSLLGYSAGSGDSSMAAVSIVNSLKYAVLATVVDLFLGLAIAYLIVRRRSWLTILLDGMAMLPLAVPGLVLAFGFFVITQGDSPLHFLNPFDNDPTPLLVIAYAVRRLPFLVRACAAGLEQTSEALEEAAVNLGASRLRTIWTVVVPLLAANLIAGALLVFSRSMLEVSDSLLLAWDRDAYPMTKAIYDLSAIPQSGLELACALGVWGMVLLTVTIAGASLALGKRLGALFRV